MGKFRSGMRRVATVCLSIALAAGTMGTSVYAQENVDPVEYVESVDVEIDDLYEDSAAVEDASLEDISVDETEDSEVEIHESITVNPVYSDFISEENAEAILDQVEVSDQELTNAYNSVVYNNIDELANTLKSTMLGRNTVITVDLNTMNISGVHPSNDEVTKILLKAIAVACKDSSNPVEGDYLRYSLLSWRTRWSSRGDQVNLRLTLGYNDTADQEQQLATRLDAIIASLGLDGLTKFEKIYVIYDYIASNVTYDYAHYNNDKNYPYQYSAWAGVVNGTCVCQGYSLLLYRMLVSQGIPCKIISGIGNGDKHAWNLVKIGSMSYNCDVTWDSGKDIYYYFLKGSDEFDLDHTRVTEFISEDFGSSDFIKKFPTSTTDYDYPMTEAEDTSDSETGYPFGWNYDSITGKSYWYENGVRQGTYADAAGVMGDGTIRGREIFDPESNAWYWLDSVYDGACAKDKEVWMPYIFQDEVPGSTQGKWVRYDSNGGMIKGWYKEARGTYYYDPITGAMTKGKVKIDGKTYRFDETTGLLK